MYKNLERERQYMRDCIPCVRMEICPLNSMRCQIYTERVIEDYLGKNYHSKLMRIEDETERLTKVTQY